MTSLFFWQDRLRIRNWSIGSLKSRPIRHANSLSPALISHLLYSTGAQEARPHSKQSWKICVSVSVSESSLLQYSTCFRRLNHHHHHCSPLTFHFSFGRRSLKVRMTKPCHFPTWNSDARWGNLLTVLFSPSLHFWYCFTHRCGSSLWLLRLCLPWSLLPWSQPRRTTPRSSTSSLRSPTTPNPVSTCRQLLTRKQPLLLTALNNFLPFASM